MAKMPTWAKVVMLVVLVAFAAMVVGIIAGARWMKRQTATLRKETQVAMEDGRRFGGDHDAEACVVESLSRLKACDSLLCEPSVKLFMGSCLDRAKPTSGLCDGVPKQSELMASPRWQYAECDRRGWGLSERCTRVITTLQNHCNAQ